MKRGLKVVPGFSATAFAVAHANLLLVPITKLSNVYFGLKYDFVFSPKSCDLFCDEVDLSI